MLQTELVRRCGPAAGLLIANVLYTFSPGHYDYFLSPRAVAIPMSQQFSRWADSGFTEADLKVRLYV